MLEKIKMEGEFKAALPVLNKIKKAGFEAYFVGGSVRDAILGLEVNDVDIATSAYPEEIKHIFPKTVDVGIEHGTVMVLHGGESYEVTTFRTESTYQDYRRPDSVTFVRSLEEDLKRRDFTINAFAVDESGEIHDYFNGKEDLNNRLIRAVGVADERFNEDALRMMRGVRFASQLDFSIEEETKQAMKRHAPLLEHIAVERIQVEWIKLLLGKARKQGLASFLETDLYRYCPDLNEHKEALVRLSELDGLFTYEVQAWTLLLHFIEEADSKAFLRKWKTSNKIIQEVQILIETIEKRLDGEPVERLTVYRIGKERALEVEHLLELLGQKANPEQVEKIASDLPMQSKAELDVTGHDLMQSAEKKPGKWMGEAMAAAEEAVVLSQVENEKEQIINWLEENGYFN